MLGLYRALLFLYPTAYRCEFGNEMMEVLSEVDAEMSRRSTLSRVWCMAQETGGLLHGAFQEHLRSITGSYDSGRIPTMFSSGRFAMRSEFRFPKATVGLMMVILAAVIFTIEKAKAISASVPHANPAVGPIQPEQLTILPSLLVAMIIALVVGVIGWAFLYALRRSGVQQLSEMNPSTDQRSHK